MSEKLTIEEKLELVKQVGEEIIGEVQLKAMLEDENYTPIAYDGFEPSGRIHIAQGLLRAINVNKLTKAGIKFKFWVADWFALMNNKMGGDMEKIQTVGKYFIEVWKACGMDMDNVEFLWASDVMSDSDYWLKVVNIGRANTVTRITRCAQIMGRTEGDSLSAAQIFYPCMQCADIFHLKADIAQLGLDQRKVNVLAREVAPKLGFKKPVIVSHHMLSGLGEPPKGIEGAEAAIAKKMSKSNPDTAIFMTDSEKDIKRKMNKAYCPIGIVEDNPVMEYAKYLVFEKFDLVKLERPEKFGGNVEYDSYAALEKDFASEKLHPMDLKQLVGNYVNEMLKPVREHFENDINAKDILKKVESYKVTK
jgi:tyrosyl-tRNA synthetase